jgi:hypothetical protein
METFLALACVWFFVKEKWLWWTVAAALLLYTDYLPALLLVALFLLKPKKALLPALGVLVLLLPLFPLFFTQLKNGLMVHTGAPGWWIVLGKTNLKELLLVPVKFSIGRISFYNKIFYGVCVVFTGAIFAFPLSRALVFWRKVKLLWVVLVLPIIFIAVLGLYVSVFSYFRLLFVLPFYYLLLVWGLVGIDNKKLRLLLGLTILSLNLIFSGVYLFTPRFHREDWKSAVSWVEQDAGDKPSASIFVTNNQRDPYFYYSHGKVASYGPDGLERGNFEKIYLFRYVQPIFDPQDTVRGKVEQTGYKKTNEKDFNGIVVWEYQKKNTYANLY